MKYLNFGALMILVLTSGFLSVASAKEKALVGASVSAKGLAVKDYPKKASLNSGQAVKAATDAVAGQVLSVGLENEDGFLVYAVEVVNPDSGLHEVIVDAGNGKVLSQEKKSEKSSHEKRGGEGNENDEEEND